MSFDALVEQMTESLAKAQSLASDADAKKVIAAADDAGNEDDEGGEELEDEVGSGNDGSKPPGAAEGGAKPLTKSFTLALENGEEVEAIDGTEMLKSFSEQLGALGAKAQASEEKVLSALSKSLEILNAQTATITTQGALLKSLRTDLDALRKQPSGRKSVTHPAQVPADAPLAKSLTGSDEQGLPPQEFLAKCLVLQKAGKLNLQDVAIAEASIGSGVDVPRHIVSKVFSQ